MTTSSELEKELQMLKQDLAQSKSLQQIIYYHQEYIQEVQVQHNTIIMLFVLQQFLKAKKNFGFMEIMSMLNVKLDLYAMYLIYLMFHFILIIQLFLVIIREIILIVEMIESFQI